MIHNVHSGLVRPGVVKSENVVVSILLHGGSDGLVLATQSLSINARQSLCFFHEKSRFDPLICQQEQHGLATRVPLLYAKFAMQGGFAITTPRNQQKHDLQEDPSWKQPILLAFFTTLARVMEAQGLQHQSTPCQVAQHEDEVSPRVGTLAGEIRACLAGIH